MLRKTKYRILELAGEVERLIRSNAALRESADQGQDLVKDDQIEIESSKEESPFEKFDEFIRIGFWPYLLERKRE